MHRVTGEGATLIGISAGRWWRQPHCLTAPDFPRCYWPQGRHYRITTARADYRDFLLYHSVFITFGFMAFAYWVVSKLHQLISLQTQLSNILRFDPKLYECVIK